MAAGVECGCLTAGVVEPEYLTAAVEHGCLMVVAESGCLTAGVELGCLTAGAEMVIWTVEPAGQLVDDQPARGVLCVAVV